MKGLAEFIMRGRMQAALVAATLAVLALIFQPLAIGSSAVIALATLRNGPRQALLVALISLLGLGAFGALLFGRPLGLLAIGLGLWLPAILLGHVLRTWRSLRLTVEAAVLAGFGLVLVQYLGSADPGEIWAELLRQLLTPMLDAGSLTEESIGQIVDVVAPWMVGGVAATWTLQLAVSVFLARWLQALLYNPGGFGSEFRALRLGYWLRIALPVLLVAGALLKGPNLPMHLALVGMTGFFLHGLALAHDLVHRLKAKGGWLAGLYVILLLGPLMGVPHGFAVISMVGFADGWLDFRTKIRPR